MTVIIETQRVDLGIFEEFDPALGFSGHLLSLMTDNLMDLFILNRPKRFKFPILSVYVFKIKLLAMGMWF